MKFDSDTKRYDTERLSFPMLSYLEQYKDKICSDNELGNIKIIGTNFPWLFGFIGPSRDGWSYLLIHITLKEILELKHLFINSIEKHYISIRGGDYRMLLERLNVIPKEINNNITQTLRHRNHI